MLIWCWSGPSLISWCCGVQAALEDLLASYSYRSVTLEQALQTMLKQLLLQ